MNRITPSDTPALRKRSSIVSPVGNSDLDRITMNVEETQQLQVEAGEASLSMADVDMNKVNPHEGKAKCGMMESVTYFLALGTVGVSALGILLANFTVTYVAMAFAIFVSPLTVVQRYRLSKMDSFRQVHNALRGDVNRLQNENNELEVQIDGLERQAEKVEDLETGLQDVLRKQGTSVNKFVAKVKENALVQAEIESLLMQEIVQQVMAAIVKADRNQDFMISPDEVNYLILRIKALPGVDHVEEKEIRRLLKVHGNGLEAILSFVRELKNEAKELRNAPSTRHLDRAGDSKPLIAVSYRNLKM